MSEYLSSQDIFNKCFNAATNQLAVSAGKSMQDCLNAVFDPQSNSLRISVSGGGAPGAIYIAGDGITIVNDKISIDTDGADDGSFLSMTEDGLAWARVDTGKLSRVIERLDTLPDAAQENLGRTVFYSGDTENGVQKGSIYVLEQIDDETFQWASIGSMGASATVKQEIITLPLANPPDKVLISVNGIVQDIDDDGDLDGNVDTLYRIDFVGHILSVENYASEEATLSDRYFCKMSYNIDNNVTSIFMTTDEYDTFSTLGNGKNVLKINYL